MRSFVLAVCLIGILSGQDADDEKQRIKTARNLGKGGSENISQLQPMLSDTAPSVRQEAVRSIIAIGTQRSIDPLVQATRDSDSDIRMLATDGIVNFYLPGYMEGGVLRLRGRFDRENTQVIDPYVVVREEAVLAIGKLVRSAESMDVRANAARAIGVLRGRVAVPDLVHALGSKHTQLIYEALIALQKIRDESTGEKVRFLLRDLEPKVQIAAIETTGLLRNFDAAPDLQRVFESSRNDKVRRAAITALAMVAQESSRPLFERAFADKDDQIRAAAAEGYARLKNPADRALVEKAFNEEQKMTPRLGAAFALVSLGDTSTATESPLSYLVNTLNSKTYSPVAQAYLSELARDAALRRPLYEYMKQATRDEKIGLGRVLAMSGGADSVASLELLSKDADPKVAQEGVRSLRSLRTRVR